MMSAHACRGNVHEYAFDLRKRGTFDSSSSLSIEEEEHFSSKPGTVMTTFEETLTRAILSNQLYF
jgi:hypothetical protein